MYVDLGIFVLRNVRFVWPMSSGIGSLSLLLFIASHYERKLGWMIVCIQNEKNTIHFIRRSFVSMNKIFLFFRRRKSPNWLICHIELVVIEHLLESSARFSFFLSSTNNLIDELFICCFINSRYCSFQFWSFRKSVQRMFDWIRYRWGNSRMFKWKMFEYQRSDTNSKDFQ